MTWGIALLSMGGFLIGFGARQIDSDRARVGFGLIIIGVVVLFGGAVFGDWR